MSKKETMDSLDWRNRIVGIGCMIAIVAWLLSMLLLCTSSYQSVQMIRELRAYRTPTHTTQGKP